MRLALSRVIPQPRFGHRFLDSAILVGGLLNGYALSVSDWVRGAVAEGEIGLPISLLDAIVIAIAFHLRRRGRSGCSRVGWPEAAALAGIAVPSVAFSWATTAAYACWNARQAGGMAKAGTFLIAGLALVQLWASVFIKWFAFPLGSLDAALAASLLFVFDPYAVRFGNTLGHPAGHSIIVLYGCTTAYFLPKLLLVQCAANQVIGPSPSFQLALSGLATTAVFATVANAVRLALMASSANLYTTIHSPVGASVFELLMIIAVGVTCDARKAKS